MICDVCGQEGAYVRRVGKVYGEEEELLVIEHIPIVTCPHCGANYLTAETLHHIERLKRKSQTIDVKVVPG